MEETMTQEIPKMELTSLNVQEDQLAKLKAVFPEVFNEDKVDWDKLRRTLGEAIDSGDERYGMNWPGKSSCFRVIQESSIGTLKPCKEESVDWDSTENLFIEGDNLEVLKLLQQAYYGKVKLIYIDPPYNTGKEFIYPDKYSESLQTYLAYTGQIDEQGYRFSTNTESSGRFHSSWLNMIYPRLFLAKNLLKEDGVILISIDDNEADNLKKACNEIFGEENFIAQLVWEKGRKNDAKLFSVGHEYILVYARSLATLTELKTIWREPKPGSKEIWDEYTRLRALHGEDDQEIESALREWYRTLPASHPSKKLSRYKNIDKNGPWRDRDISWPGGGGPTYDVIHPITKQPCKVPEAGWRFSTPEKMQDQIRLGLVVFRDDHTQPPFRKAHIKPLQEELIEEEEINEEILEDEEELTEEDEDTSNVGMQVMPSVIYKQSQVAVKHLKKLFGFKVFDNPKDHEVLARLFNYCIQSESEIILDFFAGSSSTAEAVFQVNSENKTKHRFILVQLPELTSAKTNAFKKGFKTISDVSKERIRKVIQKQLEANSQLSLLGEEKPDLGFKVFRLSNSNFKIWNSTSMPDDEISKQIELFVENINPDSKDDDILYEILSKAGFELTTKVETLELVGKKVYSIGEDTLLICLERQLTKEVITAMASRRPARVVCLDTGFDGNDQLKTNAVQIMKSHGVTDFKTV